MDWENRGVAVLFGDGCAAIVIEATTEERTGLLGETLGCIADSVASCVLVAMAPLAPTPT